MDIITGSKTVVEKETKEEAEIYFMLNKSYEEQKNKALFKEWCSKYAYSWAFTFVQRMYDIANYNFESISGSGFAFPVSERERCITSYDFYLSELMCIFNRTHKQDLYIRKI